MSSELSTNIPNNKSDRSTYNLPSGIEEPLQRTLAALRRDTSAQCVLLIDGSGAVVAEAGSPHEILDDDVLTCLAREMPITTSLGQNWHDVPVLSLHHYEGGECEVYAAAAEDLPFLLVTLGMARAPAYSAVVWLFVRRTVQELRGLLRSSVSTASGMGVGDGNGEKPDPITSFNGITLDQAKAMGLLAEQSLEEGVDVEEG